MLSALAGPSAAAQLRSLADELRTALDLPSGGEG